MKDGPPELKLVAGAPDPPTVEVAAASGTDSDDQPFFAAGLRFECQPDCGACCARPGEVHLTREDSRAMARELGMSIAAFRRRYVINDHGELRLVNGEDEGCPMLGADRRCRVYGARPAQCRTYPFWPEVVADAIAWEWEGFHCPGIGKGRLIPADEIIALCDATPPNV